MGESFVRTVLGIETQPRVLARAASAGRWTVNSRQVHTSNIRKYLVSTTLKHLDRPRQFGM